MCKNLISYIALFFKFSITCYFILNLLKIQQSKRGTSIVFLYLFLCAENKVASISHRYLIVSGNIFLSVFAGKCTRSATKKLPNWVSETSEETRSYRSRLEWAELIAILIKIRGLPGPSRNAFASRLGRLPFASVPICITVKIPGIALYMPRDVLRATVNLGDFINAMRLLCWRI